MKKLQKERECMQGGHGMPDSSIKPKDGKIARDRRFA